MPTNAQITRHCHKGLTLDELIVLTLEDARACILKDENTDEELAMCRSISSVLSLIAKAEGRG